MTREEAVGKCEKFYGNGSGEAVDLWVSLGMLKLDEPKSMDDKLRGIIEFLGPAAGPDELKYAIDISGLKIVEK